MKKIKKLLLCTIAAAGVMAVLTSPVMASAWYTAQIDRINLDTSGNILIVTTLASNHECGGKYVKIADTTTAAAKTMIAALLGYEAQKEPVRFLIISCSGTIGVITEIESSNGV